MKKWSVLLILTLWLMSSCGSSASLPPIKATTPEIIAKTHLARPTVKLKAADLWLSTKLSDEDQAKFIRLKEALRDLKIQSDAVYDDYLSR